jgi:hypothetical protein
MDNFRKDAELFKEIMDRQGQLFINDCIADYIANEAIKHKMTFAEVDMLRDKTVDDLFNAISMGI